jgi:hypothetical protein
LPVRRERLPLCSPDSESWLTVGYVTFPVEDPAQVGVHAIGAVDRTVCQSGYPDGTAIRREPQVVRSVTEPVADSEQQFEKDTLPLPATEKRKQDQFVLLL